MTPILSILILNFNTKDLTLGCVESILNHYKKQIETGEFEILIGDNASVDSSISTFKKQFSSYKNISILENKENLGFAKGHNNLSKIAKGKYLLFLNSDTKITTEGLTDAISYLDKNKEIGIMGLKMINEDGSSQASCGKFYTFFNFIIMLLGGERLGFIRNCPKKTIKIDWVSGGAMIINKDLFQKLNGFDENFFMYIEDMELCFRVKKEGYLTYFYHDIKIVHKELGSSSKRYAILSIYKGILYFYKKHKSKLEYYLVKLLFKFKAHIAIFIGIITNNISLKQTYNQILSEK